MALSRFFRNAWHVVKDIPEEVVDTVSDASGEAIDFVKEASGDVVAVVKDAAGHVVKVSVKGLTDTYEDVSDVFQNASGAVADFASDAAGEVYDKGEWVYDRSAEIKEGVAKFQMKNRLYVANGTTMEVRVAVAPNPDFLVGDIVGTCALSIITAVPTGGASFGAIPKQVKTFADLVKVFNLLLTLGTFAGIGAKALKFLQETTIAVPSMDCRMVFDKVLYNPLDYIGATGWGAIAGWHEIHLAVLLWDPSRNVLMKMVEFNTNSDSRWIVSPLSGVVRAKPGHFWVPAPDGPTHPWQLEPATSAVAAGVAAGA